tara:strand:- start:15327 stop:15743 length:417 start_codon:yes stop_codon:yes gene_type:complete
MAARSIPFLILTLCYPIWHVFQLQWAGSDPHMVVESLQNYRISIWMVWFIWAAVAVWLKWTKRHYRFFKSTYGYIVIACIIYGYYHSKATGLTGSPSPFSDSYTASFFAALLDIAVLFALTAFLQAAVWWFTQRQHRK